MMSGTLRTAERLRVAVIGAGDRGRTFLRVAGLLKGEFETVALARNRESAERLASELGLSASSTLDELQSKHDPHFAIVAVSPTDSARVVTQCAKAGLPVLAETPPGRTLDELAALIELERGGFRIQVAEQCRFRPLHQAQRFVVEQGRLGPISYVHSSIAHGYHGVNLIRDLLGTGRRPVSVTARQIKTPLRYGHGTGEDLPRQLYADAPLDGIAPSSTVVAHLDYGACQATFEFSFDQYFSARRTERLLVRGELGDLIDDRVLCLPNGRTGESRLIRIDQGTRHDVARSRHVGYTIDGAWAFENAFEIPGMSDDEIAVATCLARMAEFVRTGAAFSTLEEAAYDRAVDLAIQEAASSGSSVCVDARFAGIDGAAP